MNDTISFDHYVLVHVSSSETAEMDHESHRVSLPAPHGWEVVHADEHRILLLMEDLSDLTIDGFAPNVIVELTTPEGALSDLPENPPAILGSSTFDQAGSLTSKRTLALNETASGDTLYQLIVSHVIGSVAVMATCSALDRQWSEVAAAFDEIAENLTLGLPEAGDDDEG